VTDPHQEHPDSAGEAPAPEVIETPRLSLVAFDAARAQEVLSGRRQSFWDPGYPTPGDIEVARWVLSPRFGPRDRQFFPRTVMVRSEGLAIGGIGFHGTPDADGSVEIGYGIAQGWRTQGLGAEAVVAFVAHALTLPGVRQVVATTEVANEASLRSLYRAGFVRVGGDDTTARLAVWQ